MQLRLDLMSVSGSSSGARTVLLSDLLISAWVDSNLRNTAPCGLKRSPAGRTVNALARRRRERAAAVAPGRSRRSPRLPVDRPWGGRENCADQDRRGWWNRGTKRAQPLALTSPAKISVALLCAFPLGGPADRRWIAAPRPDGRYGRQCPSLLQRDHLAGHLMRDESRRSRCAGTSTAPIVREPSNCRAGLPFGVTAAGVR